MVRGTISAALRWQEIGPFGSEIAGPIFRRGFAVTLREKRRLCRLGVETCVSDSSGRLGARLETCVSSGENLGAVGDGRLLFVTWQKNVGDVRLHLLGRFGPRAFGSMVGWTISFG